MVELGETLAIPLKIPMDEDVKKFLKANGKLCYKVRDSKGHSDYTMSWPKYRCSGAWLVNRRTARVAVLYLPVEAVPQIRPHNDNHYDFPDGVHGASLPMEQLLSMKKILSVSV